MGQELKEGLNKVTLIGYVKEHNLKEGKGDNGKYINGSITIGSKIKSPENDGETQDVDVRVKVFVNQMTSDGSKEKATYTTLKKFIDGEYLTKAKDSENYATVKITGNDTFCAKLSEDIFANEAGKVSAISNIDLGFGNIRVEDIPEDKFIAEFSARVLVTNLKPEEKIVKDEDGQETDVEETGRLIIEGWIPVYGGQVIPFKGIVADEEFVDALISEYGDKLGHEVDNEDKEFTTFEVWGDINYSYEVKKITKGGKFGRKKEEEKRTSIHELIVAGIDDEVEENAQFDPELVSSAVKQRKLKIEEKEKEAQNKGTNANKGTGLNSKKGNTDSKTKKAKNKFNF